MKLSTTKNRLLSGLASILLGATSGWSVTAHADLSISDVPLYLAANVEPNIMFTLDDSGSMQWEFMPGDNFRYTIYLFPVPSSLYGDTIYANQIPTFKDDNVHNLYARSPENNKVFYNPDITYEPWAKSDNTLWTDANPTAAYYNPSNTSAGTIDLTSQQTESACWFTHTSSLSSAYGDPCSGSHTYWPITYYLYNSGSKLLPGSYTKVQITSSTPAGATFTSPSGIVRTRDQEIQNFANWFQYYRSRISMARAAVGRAFAEQGESMRVGFAAINQGSTSVDGESTSVVVRGVRPFTYGSTDRSGFFDELYTHPIGNAGTPLRRALNTVGKYFERTSNRGPWGNTPGTDDSTAHMECRQSYNILMTDGYWNGPNPWSTSASDPGNVDNSTGPTIARPGDTDYQYTPENPYKDSYSLTLADVAMKYWYRDLRTDLANKVPKNGSDPAVWQHLVNFTVGLGVTGTLDPDTDLPSLTSGTISWPNPGGTADSPEKLDDLWHAAVNSRGGYFSATDPETFAIALGKTLASIAARAESSASSVAANSTRLDTDTLVYQARFDSTDWSGELFAYTLDPTDGSIVTPPKWDAGQLIPAAAMRNIFTLNDTTGNGVTFVSGSLSAGQMAELNKDIDGTVDGLGSQRVAWLRGDSSAEERSGGPFRDRVQTVLGDIINSDPFYAGRQDFGYSVLAAPEGTAYTTFRSSSAYTTRPDMLYVGANDGMLHGFNATTGVESFAYVPATLYPKLTDLTSPKYDHQYYVDGSPRVGDAYIDVGSGNEWRSVLVGSTGAGGRSVFALDVTDPASFSAGDVLWELSNSELGYSIGQPTIARVKAGDRWVAIFGNGYNSASHKAQLFVVDLATGAVVKTFDTGIGSSASPNGLATPVPVDIDGDRVSDAVYAGDLHGNLWKFDLSNSDVTKWNIAYKSGSTPIPLFTAKDSADAVQPITVRPTVGRHPSGGVMVYFGTGKYFEVGDGVVPASPQVQTFYGIRDNGSDVAGRSSLQAQTILWQGSQTFDSNTAEVRAVSNNTVDYASEDGWYLDLVYGSADSERVVSSALLRHGRVIFTTLIPSGNACDAGGSSWLMELDAVSGKRLDYTVLDLNDDGSFDEKEYVTLSDGTKVPVSGNKSKEGIIRTPGVISAGDVEYKYASGSSGGLERTVEKGDPDAGRQSWRQLR